MTNRNVEMMVMNKKVKRISSRKRAFTLLEVLMVVVIIGLLAAFVGPQFFSAGDRAREDLAQAAVTSGLGGALDLYRVHMGTFPLSDEGGLQLLMEPPEDEELAEKWDGPYLKKATDLQDPWGVEWIYVYPGDINENSYDLSSAGPDKEPDTEDDIKNWQET